ncbi:unnamed protein product [Rhizoctonia solani]|uniref:Uncharacterized protein n=1 Tax=Rhizoctonia solani TaxID=456999 RepID=A0A8H3DEY7_9AGAM|nr:unnamed protein product [Rhizoctonia solani]
MAKHTLSDADHTSLSMSDKSQPAVTYVRVGRGMIKVTKYEKEDKANQEADSTHSFDSSQPHAVRAPSLKTRSSGGNKSSSMPAWVPKFRKSKKGKKASLDRASQEQQIRTSSPIQSSVDLSGQATSSNEDPSIYVSTEKPQDTLAPPPQHPSILTPPSSPIPTHHRPLRAAHSHNDLPTTNPNDMWTSIAQLESELVARYGRGAVPQLEALRERMQNMQNGPQYETESQPVYQQIEWAEDSHHSRPSWQAPNPRAHSTSRLRTRTETLPARTTAPPVPHIPTHSIRAFVDELDIYSPGQPSPIQFSISTSHSMEEGDSDDAAAYLQALGLEPSTPKEAKSKTGAHAQSSSYGNSQARHPQPARSATLPAASEDSAQARRDALIASIVNTPPEVLEQYTARRYPRSDYRAHSNEALGLMIDPSVSSRSASPMYTSPVPDSPTTRSQSSRRDLPPRPPPPSTSAPYAPLSPINISRAQASPRLLLHDSPIQNSPTSFSRVSPRPQPSRTSLTVPSPHALRSPGLIPSVNSSQLALPLVRVRITCPPQRGTLRQLPALVLLHANARASFAAATWAQMVTYCARNAGVSIARRGGGGVLCVSVEERMAEVITPGGGRGVGDEEVGFGLGYYVSVEMALEGEVDDHGDEASVVPVATLSIPLPTTLGEVAIVFRERKDIRKALS